MYPVQCYIWLYTHLLHHPVHTFTLTDESTRILGGEGESETDELEMEWPVESNLGLSVRLSALVPD